jgi:hypothetical protein
MNLDINIAQVSIRTSGTNFDLISLHQFLNIPALKRHELIRKQHVEFLDTLGNKINFLDGLKSITALIKKLREDGSYMDFLKNETPVVG